ncbi:MAG: Phosphoglycerate mutase family protein [Clostridiales bacterium 38_11]|nr:MAG: Phosphoglycerate mutase family protein [Clostridiales bacterium 38_11]HBH13389.1 histidine phosphatase family protein [Clostridiales bacterium]
MKIYITRHGETDWNRKRIIQGSMDSPLTEDGLIGAERLSVRLRKTHFDLVITSPLNRAYRTAMIILKDRNIPILKDDSLKEINCGIFEGFTFNEIWLKHPELKSMLYSDPLNFRYPGGESLNEFYDRVKNGFERIIKEHSDKTILIVAHGGTIKGLTSYMIEKADPSSWFRNVVDNCSLTEIDYNDEQFTMVNYNDTLHLNIDWVS